MGKRGGSPSIDTRHDLALCVLAFDATSADSTSEKSLLIEAARRLHSVALLPIPWRKELAKETPFRIPVTFDAADIAAMKSSATTGQAIIPFFHLEKFQPMTSEDDPRRVWVGAAEREDLERSIARQKTPVPVLYRHGKDPVKGGKAAGKVQSLTVLDGDTVRLGAVANLTPTAKAELERGDYYGASAGVLCYEDAQGVLHPFEFVEISVTNTPAVDDLGEITCFSREAGSWEPWSPSPVALDAATAYHGQCSDDKPLCCIRALLNLPVAATLPEVVDQLKRLDARGESMETDDADEFATLEAGRPKTLLHDTKSARSGKYIPTNDARARKNQKKEATMPTPKLTPKALERLGLKPDAPQEAIDAALAVHLETLEAEPAAGTGSAAQSPATVEEVVESVLGKVTERVNQRAKELFEEREKGSRVTSLLQRLVDEGKATAATKETWRATVEANPETFEKSILPSLRVIAPVRSAQFFRPETGANAPSVGTDGGERLDTLGLPINPRVSQAVVDGTVSATKIHQYARRHSVSFEAAEAAVKAAAAATA